ncbi:MAG: glycosyltransferase family 2 protein [Deltaproteobacteria bacterium]|nr:MAG: glycosyltransferase family 2 protein [Deltaproteobacteria bacterium]
MPKPITATIITLNEEANIEGVIASAARLCDEVIVVDSASTDRTVELAEAAGARVFVQPYLGDGPQKNYGVKFAKNDWIFSIDADERFEDDAVEALLALDLERAEADAYAVRRKTFIGDRWIKLWYPDWVTRLYDRRVCAYEDSIGHASVKGGRVKKVPCDLLHYSYRDYSDIVKRVDKFAARGAKQVLARGGMITPAAPLLHGISRFLKQYLIRGGVLQGVDGLNVSVISAFGAYMKYAMALEARRSGAATERKP